MTRRIAESITITGYAPGSPAIYEGGILVRPSKRHAFMLTGRWGGREASCPVYLETGSYDPALPFPDLAGTIIDYILPQVGAPVPAKAREKAAARLNATICPALRKQMVKLVTAGAPWLGD